MPIGLYFEQPLLTAYSDHFGVQNKENILSILHTSNSTSSFPSLEILSNVQEKLLQGYSLYRYYHFNSEIFETNWKSVERERTREIIAYT